MQYSKKAPDYLILIHGFRIGYKTNLHEGNAQTTKSPEKIVVLSEVDGDFKPPLIDKVSKPGWVIVSYNIWSQIELEEFYADFAKALKESLGDRIGGREAMRMTTLNTFYEVIDLN